MGHTQGKHTVPFVVIDGSFIQDYIDPYFVLEHGWGNKQAYTGTFFLFKMVLICVFSVDLYLLFGYQS